MKNLLALLITVLITTLFTTTANAMQFLDSNSVDLGQAARVKCSTGLTCTMSGRTATIVSSPTLTGTSLSLSTTLGVTGISTLTGGVAPGAVPLTNFHTFAPDVVTSGTSATPSATVVYMTQILIPVNTTITGIAVLNAATCGTNKYIVALFSSAGTPVANSALAGTLCSGASAYQKIAFTGTYAAVGPGTYWIGIYLDGATDRYYAVPATGAAYGLAGSVTTQTFGTVAAVTLPTTFTADKGPIAYTY